MNFKGPYRVVDNDANQRYTLQDLVDLSLHTAHAKLLRPYHYDHDFLDPKIVAQHAQNEFVVGEILDIRGTYTARKATKFQRTGLEVLVRWAGYDESNDSWEPYKALRFNDKFLEFCRNTKREYLIPASLEE